MRERERERERERDYVQYSIYMKILLKINC